MFTQADLDLFCAASHDRNPLHRSPEYARRTAFGQPVVYGVLGALAGLGALPGRPGERLAGLTLEFMHPLFVGVEYRVQTDGQSFALYEGRRLATRGTARFAPASVGVAGVTDGTAPRSEAAVRTEDELVPGLTVEGDYAPAAGPLQALAERFGVDAGHLAALLFASYLVGMELPGRDALFQQAAFTFEPPALTGGFRAVVTAYDRRFQLLRVRAELAGVATVETRAFVRQPTPALSAGALAELLPPSDGMAGLVALVIGASRGLGAAVARALASQGCRVAAAYSRSAAEAEQLAAETAGAVVPVQGDGADLAWCLALRERIRQEYGRLDLLVCSAAPPLLPLSLDPDTVLRAERYVADSLALTSRPLAAFLPLL
ncbi:MAG TPA: SDR family NAD(P)-dependent oxidoreductase, partial [Symbiobacteriaceae bacterium]|nr:SDR family NAD(P)-dependent oxidoreductase [Symbiobacteriaceae bacterium]